MTERRTPIREQKTAIYRRPRVREQAPPPPLHLPVRAREHAPEKRRMWPALLLFMFFVVLCGGLAAATAGWAYQRDKIMPGVQTLDIALGGLTVEGATQRLEASWRARRASLRQDQRVILTLPLSELGIVLDAEATARAALREGRNLQAPREAVEAILGIRSVQPIWYFDPARAQESLRNIAGRFEVQPVDAGVTFVEGQVRATPASEGQRLDVEATVTWLQQNAAQVAFGEPVQLVLISVAPQITDVSALVEQLNRRISSPLIIDAFDPVTGETESIEIAPAVWAQWLTLASESASDSTQVRWAVETTRVESFVVQQNEALGSRYLDAGQATLALVQAVENEQNNVRLRLFHHPRQHIVQSGETLSSIAYQYGIPYPWIQQANPAAADSLSVGQALTIPSPDVLLPLPIVESKRIVVSLSQQRMWAYENGGLKWDWPVSTGIDSSPTAPGIFQIQSHEPNAYASIWDLWMPQFMGIYRPVPTSDFMNGFHGFPTRNGTNLLWTNSIGRKVTYGCILVSNDNIALLYDWAELGVVVEVLP